MSPGLRTLLLMTLFACSSSRVELVIDPPDGTTALELTIVRGTCPNAELVVDGAHRCSPGVVHYERAEDGRPFQNAPETVSGAHAVLVVAFVGCARAVSCTEFAGPTSAVILQTSFTPIGGGCGRRRACALGGSDETCSEIVCAPGDAGVDGPPVSDELESNGDVDGDGLSNRFECCGVSDAGCCLRSDCAFVARSRCVDTNADGMPDYDDLDSDSDLYTDDMECPDEAFCDFDGDDMPDTRVPQARDDYDGDGIPNEVECESGNLRTCFHSDDDQYSDGRDRNSDNDARSDREECPDPSECLDSDSDGTPDYRQFMATRPSTCNCDSVAYECTLSGAICVQVGIDFNSQPMLYWVGPGEEELSPPIEFTPELLGNLVVPDEAWRCSDTQPTCVGESVAVARVLPDNGEELYIFDVRLEDLPPDVRLPFDTPIGLRLGRFLYSEAGITSVID